MRTIVKIWWGSAAVMIGIAIPALGTSEASDGVAQPPSPAMPAESASTHDYQWFDHSVVNLHSTAHESDLPGSSIAEWGP